MLSDLIVVHKKGELAGFSGEWLEWKTCLRHVLIGRISLYELEKHTLTEDHQVYQAAHAVQFLMEIASGLHSPMVAETEVFGQFKKFVFDSNYSNCDWGNWLSKTLEDIRISVKRIRNQHLIGVGSSSYGSYVRKHTKSCKNVNIIGSGLLTKDILPWLAKHKGQVNVYCRDLEKANALKAEFPFINLLRLNEKQTIAEGAVVVCAPVSAGFVLKRLQQATSRIIDFRGEGRQDPIKTSLPIESLHDIFDKLEQSKRQTDERVSLAKSRIQEIVEIAHNA